MYTGTCVLIFYPITTVYIQLLQELSVYLIKRPISLWHTQNVWLVTIDAAQHITICKYIHRLHAKRGMLSPRLFVKNIRSPIISATLQSCHFYLGPSLGLYGCYPVVLHQFVAQSVWLHHDKT